MITTEEPTDATGQPARLDGAYRGKRISWREFYRQRPDLQPCVWRVCEPTLNGHATRRSKPSANGGRPIQDAMGIRLLGSPNTTSGCVII